MELLSYGVHRCSHLTQDKERKKERNNDNNDSSVLSLFMSLLNNQRPNYKVSKSKRKKENTYTNRRQKMATGIV
jgi:hypothetical protein